MCAVFEGEEVWEVWGTEGNQKLATASTTQNVKQLALSNWNWVDKALGKEKKREEASA